MWSPIVLHAMEVDLLVFSCLWGLRAETMSGVQDSVIAFGQPSGREVLNQSCAKELGLSTWDGQQFSRWIREHSFYQKLHGDFSFLPPFLDNELIN